MTRIGINGVTGRMGRTLLDTAGDREDITVEFGIAPRGTATARTDESITGDVTVYDPADRRTASADHEPDVVVDFSVPAATAELADACADAGVGLVVGTTGLDETTMGALEDASEVVPVLHATNFSRGIHALLQALDAALPALPGYDVEVLETHHNGKQDAPSGTARTILETMGDHREFETVAGREGIQPREESEVGMLVRRAGDVRGEHEVLLAGNDEVLTLRHRAEDRAVFAAGALDAADWIAGRTAGWYSLSDLVGETDSRESSRDGQSGGPITMRDDTREDR
jgi:4-hydroxy-tetrahydrodipicolinate reductase